MDLINYIWSFIPQTVANYFQNQERLIGDESTQEELQIHLLQMKLRSLAVDSSFAEKIGGVEIENTELLPMCIELYEKIEQLLPDYVPPETITPKYRRYYKPGFSPEQIGKEGKQDYGAYALDFLEIPENRVPFNSADINLEEFTNSFSELANKRDMMGISKKMLFHLPDYLKIRLLNIFNRVLNGSHPIKHSLGKASYIYKEAKKGAMDEIKSYRPIITIPNVVNHLHRVLALRLADYIEKNNYINRQIQKGGVAKERKAIFQQIYKVKNVIKHALLNNKRVCILFLDLTNAFGSINREAIFTIMERHNIDKRLIDYIRDYYNNFCYFSKTTDWQVKSVEWGDGIIQGCPMSPILFVFALNYVLDYVDRKYKDEHGYELSDNLKLLLTAFMDDQTLICKDPASLETVFNELGELMGQLGMRFNYTKCALMLPGFSDEEKDQININGIPKVKKYKYLGEYLCDDGTNNLQFGHMMAILRRRLTALDKSTKKTDVQKFFEFNRYLLPAINKKMAVMYDLKKEHRLQLIVLVKEYLQKWGSNDDIQLFPTIEFLLDGVTDPVVMAISRSGDGEEPDEMYTEEELAEYTMKRNNLKFEYEKKIDLLTE